MSRRPAACVRSLIAASLAAIALSGCRGDRDEPKPPQPVAAATSPAEPPATPTADTAHAPAPAAAPVDTPPATTATPAASEPQPAPAPAPTPGATPAVQQQQPDAMQWMRDGEARKADHKRRLAEAEMKLESANLSMITWERNVLAFKNPFLARPQLSPEDTQAIAGMNGAERVRWAEGRLASVSTERDAAQKTLDELRKNPPQN